MNRIRIVAPGIVCCLMGAGLAAALSSCMIVLPALVSHSARSYKTGWPTGRVLGGQRVTLHMADDSVIKGRLEQVRPIEGAAYREWHEQTFPVWAERWGLCLKLGEPAGLRLRSGDRLRGTLAEVDQGSVTITVHGNDRRIPLEEWERLDLDGDCSVNPSTLASIPGQDWPLPPLLLVIRTREGEMAEIRSDEVVRTVKPVSADRLGGLLLAGLAVDAVVIAMLYLNMDFCIMQSSCP